MASVSDINGLIVEAVADDEALRRVSVEMGRLMDAESVLIQSVGAAGPAIISADISRELLVAYEGYFWRHDLWITDHPAHMAHEISISDDYVASDRMLKSEIYNDLLKRIGGDIFRLMGFKSPLADRSTLFVGVHHTRRREFAPRDVHHLDQLRPALVALTTARQRLQRRRGLLAEHVVDSETDPAMVVGADGRLLFLNPAAVRILENGPLCREGGRLSAPEPTLAARTLRAVRAAAHGRLGQVLDAQGGDVRIAVDPLDGDMSGSGATGGAPLVLVRVRLAAERRARVVAAAATAWRLTHAERELADAVLRGLNAADHARRRGVSIATVRTQLRALYGKADAGGRSELLSKLHAHEGH